MRLIISIRNSNVEDLTYAWFGEFLWSSAEITSGILCSCFPVLPSFVRYFYGKVTTKLSKDHNDNSALFTYRESSIQSPTMTTTSNLWYDSYDSQLLQRSYLELQARSDWDFWDVEEAPEPPELPEPAMTTTTKGGARESQETVMIPACITRNLRDMRHGGMHSGILNTVTAAQYPKAIATVH
ncbi:hypothetical protein MMC29_000061 [Sticta canariensis]|nr:hypothetical protein [Sticta canariensis]